MERSELRSNITRYGALLATALAFLILWKLAHVLLLLFSAVLFAVFLDGGARLCQRDSVGRGGALAFVSIMFVLGLVGAFLFVGPQLAEQFQALADLAPTALEQTRTYLQGTGWGKRIIQAIPSELDPKLLNGEVFDRVTGVFSSAAGFLLSLLAVFVIGLYLAIRPETYVEGMIHLVTPERRAGAREVLHSVGYALRRWLVGRFVAMIVVAILTTIGLGILGVPAPFALGVLVGVLTFVPFLGPVLAAVPAVGVALVEGPILALWVAGLYTVVQLVENNVVTPLVEQRAVLLPAGLMLAFEIVMGVLAGLLGVLLATPLLVMIVVGTKLVYVRGILGEEISVLGDEEESKKPGLLARWRHRGSREWHPRRRRKGRED